MSALRTRQRNTLAMAKRAQPFELLLTASKILSLTNIIPLSKCMFVFDNLKISLPAIFNDSFKTFKDQHIHNTWGTRRYVLNIPMKTFFIVPNQFNLYKD